MIGEAPNSLNANTTWVCEPGEVGGFTPVPVVVLPVPTPPVKVTTPVTAVTGLNCVDDLKTSDAFSVTVAWKIQGAPVVAGGTGIGQFVLAGKTTPLVKSEPPPRLTVGAEIGSTNEL